MGDFGLVSMKHVVEILVELLLSKETSWERMDHIIEVFSSLHLLDKVVPMGDGNGACKINRDLLIKDLLGAWEDKEYITCGDNNDI